VPARVTGYFEPVLRARVERDAKYRWPLYRMPTPAQLDELTARFGHVPTRADIDGGDALAGLGLELAWVDDPVDRFFLQVQGSGRLDLGPAARAAAVDAGKPAQSRGMRLAFAGTNGLDYRSVGAVMLEKGLLERGAATAPAMRAWLASHPAERDELLAANPRYVFFRDRGDEAVTGSLGAPLVAGRSVAADPAALPPGALAWLATTQPVLDAAGRAVSRRPVTRFVFVHDTGAAIRGEARVDLFTGSGDAAGMAAGGMNEQGSLAVLLCDDQAPRRKSALATRPLPGPRMPAR
jgi:membrane-bound lytic murein transglycosylase A